MSDVHDHHEEMIELAVELEKDQVEALFKLAEEYSAELGQEWDLSAVLRLACGDFLNKLGKIL